MARSRRIPDVMVKHKDELRLRRAAGVLSTRLYCLLSEFNSSHLIDATNLCGVVAAARRA